MEKRRIPIQSTSVASYLSRVCLLFSRLISPPCFAEKGELRRFPLKVAQLGAIANSGRSKLLAQKLSALTPRETDVLRLIGIGATNRQIAEKLYISEATVKTHVTHLLNRLNMNNRSQLAIYAHSVFGKAEKLSVISRSQNYVLATGFLCLKDFQVKKYPTISCGMGILPVR